MIDTKALRSRVLDLAIRGKLTEQFESDGTAEELYRQIQEEKQKLIKEGKIKKEKPLPEIRVDEIPFGIPKNWKWVSLGSIVSILGGKRIPAGRKLTSENTGHKYIRVSDMKNMTVDTSNLLYVPEDIYQSISRYVINKEDVYITVAGTIGKVGTIPDEIDGANLTENADRLVFSHLNKKWLVYCLSADTTQKQIELLTTQVAQPKLAIKRIQEFYIPLPSFAEQKRIVQRVEEIFKLLDTIDAAQEKYTADAESLKAKLITAGIQGKLTEQLDSDGTAEELYQQIQAEKQKLIKDGKIKKEKPLPAIKDEEIPFEIPGSWKWVRMNEITIKITDGTHHSPINTESGDFMYVTAKNIKDKGVDLSNITYVTKEVHDEIYARCNPELNDVLLIKDGATTGVVTVNNIDEPFSLLSSVALIKPVHELVESWYIAYVLRSSLFYKTIRAQMTGTGITRIVLRQIEPFIVPLPPRAEQKRIAEVLERAMGVLE